MALAPAQFLPLLHLLLLSSPPLSSRLSWGSHPRRPSRTILCSSAWAMTSRRATDTRTAFCPQCLTESSPRRRRVRESSSALVAASRAAKSSLLGPRHIHIGRGRSSGWGSKRDHRYANYRLPTSNTQRCLAIAHCIATARSRSTPKKVSAEDATSEDARSPGNSTNLPPRYYKCYMSRSR